MFRVEMDTGHGGWGWDFERPEEVYSNLLDEIGHKESFNVQLWCKYARVGEIYKGKNFQVYVLDD